MVSSIVLEVPRDIIFMTFTQREIIIGLILFLGWIRSLEGFNCPTEVKFFLVCFVDGFLNNNKSYTGIVFEGDVDYGGEEDETEDTDGVKVEHLHISDYQGFALIFD